MDGLKRFFLILVLFFLILLLIHYLGPAAGTN